MPDGDVLLTEPIPCPTCGITLIDPEADSECRGCVLRHLSRCLACDRGWHSSRYAACKRCRESDPDGEKAMALLRETVLARDRWTCRVCGDNTEVMQVVLVQPRSAGGTADPWNVCCACTTCRDQKDSRPWQPGGYYDRQLRVYMQHVYLTYLHQYLSTEEQHRLRRDANAYGTEFDHHRYRHGAPCGCPRCRHQTLPTEETTA